MADAGAPKKKARLVRPRGRRGGVKNRRKTPRGATEHAKLIAKYHTLEKQIARTTDEAERARLVARQQALGGLAVYQDQSLTGSAPVRGGESGKWCVQALRALWPKERGRIRLLDVGAIAGTAYAKWPRLVDVTSIDLHPRADHVMEYDFFAFPVPAADARYDVVGLSLVLNFVGDLHQRGTWHADPGDMLLHAHRYLQPRGYVYVVLPLACVQNSRYMTHDHLRRIFQSTGYEVVRHEDSPRLTRWLLQQIDTPLSPPTSVSPYWDGTVYKKRELQGGARRNNFCILLGGAAQARA